MIADAQKETLFSKQNVVGVGLGKKKKDREPTGEKAIIVMVTKKMHISMLDEDDIVPSSIGGFPTDVVEVGYIQAPPPFVDSFVWTDRVRPPQPGISIGHKDITAGTFGCVVEKDGTHCILSNNHVLACSNNAKIGDTIVQPGMYDGGVASRDRVAGLYKFVPIVFSNIAASCAVAKGAVYVLNKAAEMMGSWHRLQAYSVAADMNLVDAALAVPEVPIEHAIIDGVGIPNGTASAGLETKVHKCGRTTGHTYGEVEQIEATVQVSYGRGKVAFFENQIIFGPMSAGGDSGSAVLDMDNNVVGLLFAGSDKITIASPIDAVLDSLGITVVV